MRRAGPRPLAHAIERLVDEVAPATLLADVARVWPQAVGPAIAAAATPVSERDGVVSVACGSAVWAQELDLLAEQVIGRLDELLGAGRVRRLRCLATPPPAL
jgi:predicted nucleic acid-binding Zn ribbon protein